MQVANRPQPHLYQPSEHAASLAGCSRHRQLWESVLLAPGGVVSSPSSCTYQQCPELPECCIFKLSSPSLYGFLPPVLSCLARSPQPGRNNREESRERVLQEEDEEEAEQEEEKPVGAGPSSKQDSITGSRFFSVFEITPEGKKEKKSKGKRK